MYRIEPNIRFHVTENTTRESLRLGQLVVDRLLFGEILVEELGMLLQILVAESRSQLAHRLELLRVHVVTRQQEGSKRSRSLSLSIITSDGNEIE